MDLKELESGVNPETHWYYQTKKVPLLAFVKKIFTSVKTPLTLVDVGSGSGFFMYEVEKDLPAMISKIWLVDIGYSDDEITATKGKKIEKTKSLPDAIENGVVVMMDVLEHLEDPQAMLAAIRQRAVGNNYFFITVPAFMSLWSGHDVYLGHYRRYTSTTLRNALKQEAYSISNLYYLYGLIFPAVWVARKMKRGNSEAQSDMKPMGAFTNAALKMVCRAEMPFRKWNGIAGVTCTAEGKI